MDTLELELKPTTQWVADRKRRVCAVCERKFGTFVRKHHCRSCGEVICSQCSSHRHVRDILKPKASSRTVRLCTNCISPVLIDTAYHPSQEYQSIGSMSLVNSYQSDSEGSRITTLRSYMILDTPHEQEFDAICRAAAKTFDCSVAAIAFLDTNRQWYKARIGIQPPQVPREVALCEHLLERPFNTPLVVLDTLKDDRFQQNPLVTGAANVRFYAGLPIVNHEGHVLGSIMVLDCKPRESVDTGVTDMLLHLAKIIMDMLEDHKARELRRLTMIEEASNEHRSERSELDMIPMMNSGSSGVTVRQSTEEELMSNHHGLATPPDSQPRYPPWSIGSSSVQSKCAVEKAKAIDLHTAAYRGKLIQAIETGSGSNKSNAESACLDLLCRVTDTQQMLAQQQTIIFERLSYHTNRMDELEASMRNLEAAFDKLAAKVLDPSSQTSNSDSVGSEFITI